MPGRSRDLVGGIVNIEGVDAGAARQCVHARAGNQRIITAIGRQMVAQIVGGAHDTGGSGQDQIVGGVAHQ